ncbi:hypothetical protein [Ktedonobacter sp. SOSP1-52]|uniref:hypothetical protein n=1 Tax=Ktedonobacter sp. SOSP1-52 TaxID=2778366 RepID=UPI001F487506|nr:hypothetical protein [Ktedonobacter sp. SOSP1-52]
MHLLIKHHWDTTHKTWSPTQFTTHVARHGRTLCRNGKPDADSQGNISSRGWRLSLHGKPQHISCKSCLHHLEKTAIETTLIEQASEEKTRCSVRHPSLLPHLLTQITHARLLHQAHFYLAWACASELEEDEIAIYQQHQLFLPHQCLRLLLLLYTASESSHSAGETTALPAPSPAPGWARKAPPTRSLA